MPVTPQRAELRKASEAITPPVLCIGVDVTWWGGSGKKGDKESRRECIASAVRLQTGWQTPRFRSVDLNPSYNPQADPYSANADPTGAALVAGLDGVLADHPDVTRVVISLDAPLLSNRTHLPVRRKSQTAGEVERRDCDSEWAKNVSRSPAGWRNINIQPGAPLPPRIIAVVRSLQERGFGLYDHPAATPPLRLLFECFPNEVIWSAGVLEACADFSYASHTAYKRMGRTKVVLPEKIVKEVFEHTLEPSLHVAGLPLAWLDCCWHWLAQQCLNGCEGKMGKLFDDTIDSMLSLIAAAAFAEGNAHVHQGDPADGHIIGPGLYGA